MPTFTNQATLSYNGNTINSNTVTGNILEVLNITKTAVGGDYTANDDITYIVSITNAGSTPYTDVTVTDNLGEYSSGTGTLVPLDYVDGSLLYYQNGVLQTAPTPTSTSPLVISGITVPANGNVILVYEASVNGFAPLASGSTITNQVSLTNDCLSAPLFASETVAVANEPMLSITKALDPVDITGCSEITYTFTILNSGNTPAVATDDVIITDTFDPALSDITVTLNGTVLTPSSYTYNELTGEFSTLPGTITVPAATYTQDPVTGNIVITPGVTVLTVTGTI